MRRGPPWRRGLAPGVRSGARGDPVRDARATDDPGVPRRPEGDDEMRRRRPDGRRLAAPAGSSALDTPGIAAIPITASTAPALHLISAASLHPPQPPSHPGTFRDSRAISSAGRAPSRQGGGRWFEPSIAHSQNLQRIHLARRSAGPRPCVSLPSSRRDGRQAVVHRSSRRLSVSDDGGMAVRHQAAGGLVAGISCVSTRSVGARMNTSHIMSGCCWLPLMKPITRRPVACSITASKRSRISSWNSMRC